MCGQSGRGELELEGIGAAVLRLALALHAHRAGGAGPTAAAADYLAFAALRITMAFDVESVGIVGTKGAIDIIAEVVVLGDSSEPNAFAEQQHRRIGRRTHDHLV